MAVPLPRNAFAENRPDLFIVLSKRSENVLFSFFLHKTTKRYSFRKIFAVLSVILRLQKRGTEFLGNDLSFFLSFFLTTLVEREKLITRADEPADTAQGETWEEAKEKVLTLVGSVLSFYRVIRLPA